MTTALIERFYDNLELNHNIQYISMGVIEMINKSSNAELVNTMASLSVVTQSLRNGGDALMEGVLFALAQHPSLARKHQRRFAQSDHESLCVVLASREDLHVDVESVLLQSQYTEVATALASNSKLSTEGMERLLEGHEAQIIAHVAMNTAYFEMFFKRNPKKLGSNPTLNTAMFEQLLALNDADIDLALAANVSLPQNIADRLYNRGNAEVLTRLARNAATQKCLLERLFEKAFLHESLAKNPLLDEQMIYRLRRSTNTGVLEALAANEATPLDLLYEFLLDMHLEPIVRQNSALNTKYQR